MPCLDEKFLPLEEDMGHRIIWYNIEMKAIEIYSESTEEGHLTYEGQTSERK